MGFCAGGVEQGGFNIRLSCRRREAARAQGKDAVKIGHRGGRSLIGIVSLLSGIDQPSLDRQRSDCFASGGEMSDVAEQQRTAAILQQGSDLVGVQSSVERNGGAS